MGEARTRRRGAQLEQAILDAVWAELQDVGYTGLTIGRVAARAGTSKPVLYRRWSSRAALVLAAWTSRQPTTAEKIDTGALRSDLLILFTRIARRADSIRSEVIAGVMGEAFRDPEVVTLMQEQLKSAPLAEAITRIVGRASARGELPAFAVPVRVSRIPLDLIRAETVFGVSITDEAITELVDDVYLPLLHGLGATYPRPRGEEPAGLRGATNG